MSLEDLSPQDRAMLEAGRKLFTNPEISPAAKRLLMKADPNAKFEDVRLEDEIGKVREASAASVTQLEEKMAKQAAEARIREARLQLKADGVDVDALEAFMKENEIWSYDKAAKIFGRINTMATPTAASVTPLTMPDNKGLWTDPKKWANAEAHKAMDDVIANRGKARTA